MQQKDKIQFQDLINKIPILEEYLQLKDGAILDDFFSILCTSSEDEDLKQTIYEFIKNLRSVDINYISFTSLSFIFQTILNLVKKYPDIIIESGVKDVFKMFTNQRIINPNDFLSRFYNTLLNQEKLPLVDIHELLLNPITKPSDSEDKEIRDKFNKLLDFLLTTIQNEMTGREYDAEKAYPNLNVKISINESKEILSKFPYNSDLSSVVFKYLTTKKLINHSILQDTWEKHCKDIVDYPKSETGVAIPRITNILHETGVIPKFFIYLNEKKVPFTQYDTLLEAVFALNEDCNDIHLKLKPAKDNEKYIRTEPIGVSDPFLAAVHFKIREYYYKTKKYLINEKLDTFARDKIEKNVKSTICSLHPISRLIYQYPFLFSYDTRYSFLNIKYISVDHALSEKGSEYKASIIVRKDKIFEDGLKILKHCGPGTLNWDCKFYGEAGIGSGPSREFIFSLTNEFLQRDQTFRKYEMGYMPIHGAKNMKEFGILIAKTIIMQATINDAFCDAFFKLLCGERFDWTEIDKSYANMFNNPEKLIGCDLATFNLGDGDITEENCQYVLEQFKVENYFKYVLEDFIQGFGTVMAPSALKLFSSEELKQIICGNNKYNYTIEDLRESIDCSQGVTPNIQKWLFEILAEFDQETFQNFLKFVTGSQKFPQNDLKKLNPKISLDKGDQNLEAFPTAKTCMRRIKIPDYPTKEILREKLLYAISNIDNMQFGYD
ncbi:hypothetical protein TVAG_036330 [Trichomonas vaginalis G3]|uniref:HECT domain-containing protein n=2 Tax=Trichomonas vaginalis (strain ATCC PRA-98 / G3) TaxID=412133 RepID=A2DAV4_TRIV3|nr:hypothetical protein TVAG_036330 [Trichomonas vaginalis G3]|eukprot:XP_001583593.1 hypothetical protein [Trichomonas vaginalis G3]